MYHLIIVAGSFLGFVFVAETFNPFPRGRYHLKKHGIHARKKKLGMHCSLVVLTIGFLTPYLLPTASITHKLILVTVAVVLFCLPAFWFARRSSS